MTREQAPHGDVGAGAPWQVTTVGPGVTLPPAVPDDLVYIPLDYPYPHDKQDEGVIAIVLPRCLDRPEMLRERSRDIERPARELGDIVDHLTGAGASASTYVEGDLARAVELSPDRARIDASFRDVQESAVVFTGALRLYVRTIEDFNETADRLNGQMQAVLHGSSGDGLLQHEYARLRHQAKLAIEFFQWRVERVLHWLSVGPTDRAQHRFGTIRDRLGLAELEAPPGPDLPPGANRVEAYIARETQTGDDLEEPKAVILPRGPVFSPEQGTGESPRPSGAQPYADTDEYLPRCPPEQTVEMGRFDAAESYAAYTQAFGDEGTATR